jgi:tetratricopeptide (TPR) repeat protein
MANKNLSEQIMAKIIKEMKSQNLQTEDQINSFMNGIIGKNIDELDFGDEGLTDEDKSNELVDFAYESSPKKGKQLIEQALTLDPDDADAYNYLGGLEQDIKKALDFYIKATEAGKRKLGKKVFKEDKGHFWYIIETRPFMRVKFNLAEALAILERDAEAVKHYVELLELNPDDNLGVRYELLSILLKNEVYDSCEDLVRGFPDETSSLWLYNVALYYFKTENPIKARRILKKAKNENQHVSKFLLGKKKLPDSMPEYIAVGGVEEAALYVAKNKHLWYDAEGAIQFFTSE